MNFAVEPSWETRHAGQPPPTPVGPVTKGRPNLSVRMLGSAAPLLPLSNRFLLKVAEGGACAATGIAGTDTQTAAASVVIAARAVARRKPVRMVSLLAKLNAAAQERAVDRIAVTQCQAEAANAGRPVNADQRERDGLSVMHAGADDGYVRRRVVEHNSIDLAGLEGIAIAGVALLDRLGDPVLASVLVEVDVRLATA